MRNRIDAILDGISLASLHPSIFVQDIDCRPAERSVSTTTLAGRPGERIAAEQWKPAKVKIVLRILERDMLIRRSVMDQVTAWAQGEMLQISGRPGERLRVHCTSNPAITSVVEWVQEISLELTAYNPPFWMSQTAARLAMTGSSGSGNLYVPGNAGDAPAEVTVTPKSTLDTITITVAGTQMTLSGIGATTAQPLTISYDEEMRLRIRRGNVSVLDKRSAASDDDLLAVCGKYNEVRYNASGNVDISIAVRGRWI